MRSFPFLISCLVICTLFPAFAQAGVPACIRKTEARAKRYLRTPASQKKAKSKSKSKKNAKAKDDSVKLSQYTPLTWTGKKENGWMEVKAMSGRSYWVRRRDLSFSMKCLSVQVKQSRLRTGPGTQFERAPAVAQQGDVFLDLGGEDGWTQVMNSKGEKAWINLDHTWRPASKMRMVFQPEK